MQLEVVAVGVGGEQVGGDLGDPRAHGHQLQPQHVDLTGLPRPEEVGQAEVPPVSLSREREPVALGRVDGRFSEQDEVVALAHHREVSVDDRSLEQVLGLHPLQPHPQPRAALGLDQLLVRRTVAARRRADPTGP